MSAVLGCKTALPFFKDLQALNANQVANGGHV